MKVRKGFVSNSSSSSFICVICGEKAFSADGSFEACEDIEMTCPGCQETYFHVICIDHLPEDGHCPICAMEILSLDDADSYLRVPEVTEEMVLAWIKETNKRRKKTRAGDYANYILSKRGGSLDNVLDEIKAKFANYDDFRKSLRNF